MNNIQKAILAIGIIAFGIMVALYPVKNKVSINNPDYDPKYGGVLFRQNPYVEVERLDFGATALRGLAVLGTTAVAYLIAGEGRPEKGGAK